MASDMGTELAGEMRRVVRHFQRFTPELRAARAASHLTSARSKRAVGEYFYTHPECPGRAFLRRSDAARAAITERRRPTPVAPSMHRAHPVTSEAYCVPIQDLPTALRSTFVREDVTCAVCLATYAATDEAERRLYA